MIGIDHHEAVLFVDLGDHHILRAAAVLAVREKTHPRFDLVDAAKLLGGHPLLQRLVALAVSLFGRQGRHDAFARHLALEGSFEGGQQPPAAVQILQRLVAPDCRTDVTDRAVGAQRVVDGHVLSDADSRRRADWRRRVFMREFKRVFMREFKREVMRMSRAATYHSSFSILRTTTWVSRVKIPVGPQ